MAVFFLEFDNFKLWNLCCIYQWIFHILEVHLLLLDVNDK